MVNWAVNVHPRQSRWPSSGVKSPCLLFLKAILWRYIFMRHSILFALFSHILVWQSQSPSVFDECMFGKDTFSSDKVWWGAFSWDTIHTLPFPEECGDGGTYEEGGPPLLTILGPGAWFCRQFWTPTGSILYLKKNIYSTWKIQTKPN